MIDDARLCEARVVVLDRAHEGPGRSVLVLFRGFGPLGYDSMEVDDVSVVLYHGERGDGALCALEHVDPYLKFGANRFELRLQQQYALFAPGEVGVENGVCGSELVRP